MSFNFLRNLIFVFVAAIFFGGIYADNLPHRDFYPFFSWSLFSNVSQNDKSYFIRFKNSYDDEGIIIYSGRVSEYLNVDFLPNYFWDIQEIGKSVEGGNADERLKGLENSFKVLPYSYEIIKLEYDPWTLKSKGEYFSISIVREFKKGIDY